MTPKEKAAELLNKYEKLIIAACDGYPYFINNNECALIAVDEIIHSERTLVENLLSEDSKKFAESGIQYWIEVKEEINSLQNEDDN